MEVLWAIYLRDGRLENGPTLQLGDRILYEAQLRVRSINGHGCEILNHRAVTSFQTEWMMLLLNPGQWETIPYRCPTL